MIIRKTLLSKYIFPEHVFISEVSFAPKKRAVDEDDGYLVTISNDVLEKSSSCLLFDAKDIEQGPVCEISFAASDLFWHSCNLGSKK